MWLAMMVFLIAGSGLTAEPPCQAGDRLFEAGSLAAAERAYMLQRAAGDPEGCAGDGLARVAAAARNAEALVGLGRYKQAHGDDAAAANAYRRALETYPGYPRAEVALDELSRPRSVMPDARVRRVEALARAGFFAEAQQELRTFIAENPDATIPRSLAHLTEGRLASFRWYARNFTDSVIVVSAFVAVLFIGLVTWMRRRFAKAQIRFEEFETYPQGPSGRAVAAMVQDRLARFLRSPGASTLMMVHGPISGVSIPANLTAAIPATLSWLGVIPALVSALFPRREILVSGVILPKGGRGSGLTLTVSESKAGRRCITVWNTTFEASNATIRESDIYDLVSPATIWLLYDLAKRFRISTADLLGTGDWLSFAYLRAGLAYGPVDEAAAEEMFIRAIEADPGHRAARVNFATILLNAEENERAIEQLERVKKDEQEGAERDPAWYSARYRLALAHYNAGDATTALAEAEHLLRKVETMKQQETEKARELRGSIGTRLPGARAALRKISLKSRPDVDEQLLEYLTAVGDVVRVMVAGLQAVVGRGNAEATLAPVDRTVPSAEVQYNLACTWSLMTVRAPDPDARDATLDKSLAHLKLAIRISPHLRRWALVDPSLAEVRANRADSFRAIVHPFAPERRTGTVT